jgi:hypothetical protein
MYTTHNQHTTSTTPHQPFHINHSTTTLFLLLFVAIAATSVITPAAHSQSPAPVGTIHVGLPITCPSNFYTGMTCLGAEVLCPNTDNIDLTIGYVTQATTTPTGTIVFFTGGSGTSSDFGPTNSFADSYVGSYVIVYVEWASAWEKAKASGTENLLYAACRPATLLKWVNDSGGVHPNGAMCAQGKSAGTAAIAYSMSWYGADSYLTNVELLAGPVLSEIDQGCMASPPSVTICGGGSGQPSCQTTYSTGWPTSAGYTSDKLSDISSWTGVSDCTQSTITSGELTTLKNMSIVDGSYSPYSPKFSFNTKRHGWVCAGPNTNYYLGATDCPGPSSDCPNNSSPQGWYWYAAPTTADSNLVVTGTNTCEGDGTGQTLYSEEAEGVEDGFDPIHTTTAERTEIVSDMTTNCTVP